MFVHFKDVYDVAEVVVWRGVEVRSLAKEQSEVQKRLWDGPVFFVYEAPFKWLLELFEISGEDIFQRLHLFYNSPYKTPPGTQQAKPRALCTYSAGYETLVEYILALIYVGVHSDVFCYCFSAQLKVWYDFLVHALRDVMKIEMWGSVRATRLEGHLSPTWKTKACTMFKIQRSITATHTWSFCSVWL